MLKALAEQQQDCKNTLDKYQVESFLTEYLSNELLGGGCGLSPEDATNDIEEGLLSYCDMGPEKTVIQNDHSKLVRVVSSDSLPCRWFTREGLRISSLQQLGELAEKAAGEHAAQDDCNAHGLFPTLYFAIRQSPTVRVVVQREVRCAGVDGG